MEMWKKAVLFYLGGCAYVGLELMWRGRSHGSMFAAGGLCFLLIGGLNRTEPKLPLPFRAAAGAGIVTAVELGTGLLANRDYRVWDYRGLPGNLWGQICPQFTLLWIPVSLAALGLYDLLDKKIGAAVRCPGED